jgi:hypothetical protein
VDPRASLDDLKKRKFLTKQDLKQVTENQKKNMATKTEWGLLKEGENSR